MIDGKHIFLAATASLLCVSATAASAQSGTRYTDSRGKAIYFPMGNLSFADEVVEFLPGAPPPPKRWDDARLALGPPDFVSNAADERNPSCLTLGGGGRLTVRFRDNYLVDVPGADLYIFEVGPAIEATNLEISPDGKSWVNLGRIEGATAEVDISGAAKPGEMYQYVRLTDLRAAASGRFAGADIDAVGAIGSGMRIDLKSSVLFDFGKSTLKPGADEALKQVARLIEKHAGASILIEGHTDDVGDEAYNQRLSQERAKAVEAALRSYLPSAAAAMTTRGHGESRPTAANSSEKGREMNRRVEIVIVPSQPVSESQTGSEGRMQGESIAGAWNSAWGRVTIVAGSADERGLIPVSGYWDQSASQRGVIEKGQYDPKTRELVFTYFQHWNNENGVARLQLSGDSSQLNGSWQQGNRRGAWNMSR